MSHTGVLTADCFFGKAMTIEGLAEWARHRIERIEKAKKQLKHDWRGLCLLRTLVFFLWWAFLRPLRRNGIKAFESVELGRISITMNEIDTALDQLLTAAQSRGYDSHFLLCGAFRTLISYRIELKRFAAMVHQASTEWDKVTFERGNEAIEQMRNAIFDRRFEYPPHFTEQDPADSSLDKTELRDHLGRVVLRS